MRMHSCECVSTGVYDCACGYGDGVRLVGCVWVWRWGEVRVGGVRVVGSVGFGGSSVSLSVSAGAGVGVDASASECLAAAGFRLLPECVLRRFWRASYLGVADADFIDDRKKAKFCSQVVKLGWPGGKSSRQIRNALANSASDSPSLPR